MPSTDKVTGDGIPPERQRRGSETVPGALDVETALCAEPDSNRTGQDPDFAPSPAVAAFFFRRFEARFRLLKSPIRLPAAHPGKKHDK